MHFRGHLVVLVELLHRRLQHFRFIRDHTAPAIGRQLDALDDAAAPHLKDLDDSARRPDL